jgi:hypothetical protein
MYPSILILEELEKVRLDIDNMYGEWSSHVVRT